MTKSLTEKARAGRLAALDSLDRKRQNDVSIFGDYATGRSRRAPLTFLSRRAA